MEQQISPEIASLIGVVAERWGYYLAKRVLSSELMRSTSVERMRVKNISKSIQSKVNDWMVNGADTRSEIISLQGELAKAREELKVKASPYYEKMTPLIKAVSYLDKVVIPAQIGKVTGVAVTPIFQIAPETLKAITKPQK